MKALQKGWLVIIGGLFAAVALAEPVTYWEQAQVVESVPVYQEIEWREPVEHCTRVAKPPSQQANSGVPAVVGGIIGGVLGSQVGGGSGNKAATAAGVVLGTVIGHDTAQRADAEANAKPGYRRECEWRDEVHRKRELSGYRVTYRYRGQLHETITKTPPGDTIRLAVRVTPAE